MNNHIRNALKKSSAYEYWLQAMPDKTPDEILKYKNKYENSDLSAVSREIEEVGGCLSSGQYLFHGGLWSPHNCDSFVTTRPLSASFSPQVAFSNALHKAKAYDAGRLDLFVLRSIDRRTKAFAFKKGGMKLSHEMEVLLASRARLTRRTETLIRSDYVVTKRQSPEKEIPIYVLEIDFSNAQSCE